ncbi:BTB/POZ and MATH domain-containing protein 1-like [Triticum dicoccoides]|uniref:BTB/POZ and MATH domain-containing protein 1-like n=1 Tax=Triticum dicoccoides TaxID=85692 RepID=UPI0018916FF6|nr:BTB/POZ and MATH domain-containing protein 1-like [Triticum dicoccoides]
MSRSRPTMSPSRSASAIVADKTEGYHFLTIHDYSRTKGVPTGEGIGSQPFTVGGHRWCIYYYPNGDRSEAADYVSFSLELEEEDGATAVKAQFRFCFAGEEEEAKQAALLALASVDEFTSRGRWVCTKFINRKVLENSKHLKNNSFMVRCDILVIHRYRSTDNAVAYVSVPPCDSSQDFGELLETEKGADMVFEVGDETVAAHRCVLAARSPVFAAELFGPMKEGNVAAAGVVRLEDMEMEVFKALLRYAYTSSLSLQGMANDHITCWKILIAADRYGMGRLKLICEEWICECINVDTVVTILALAEQHHCEGPKQACFDFLADPTKLRAVMVTSGFQHLWESCPSLMMELMDMCLPH